jgi:hypothetical protein
LLIIISAEFDYLEVRYFVDGIASGVTTDGYALIDPRDSDCRLVSPKESNTTTIWRGSDSAGCIKKYCASVQQFSCDLHNAGNFWTVSGRRIYIRFTVSADLVARRELMMAGDPAAVDIRCFLGGSVQCHWNGECAQPQHCLWIYLR